MALLVIIILNSNTPRPSLIPFTILGVVTKQILSHILVQLLQLLSGIPRFFETVSTLMNNDLNKSDIIL